MKNILLCSVGLAVISVICMFTKEKKGCVKKLKLHALFLEEQPPLAFQEDRSS